jgi:hypothetical protein
LGWQAFKIANKILNTELANYSADFKKHLTEPFEGQPLILYVKVKDISGSVQTKEIAHEATTLIQKRTIDEFLQKLYPEMEIVDWNCTAKIHGAEISIPKQEFLKIWEKSEVKASKNSILNQMWKEKSKLEKLGREILKSLLTK